MSFIHRLVEYGIISQDQISEIENRQVSGEHLDKILIESGIDEQAVFNAKKDYFSGTEAREQTSEQPISPTILQYIPEKSAVVYGLVPLGVREGVLEVGTLDPDNLSAKSALEFISGANNMPYKIFLIPFSYYNFIITNYSSLGGEVTKALDALDINEAQLESQVGLIDPNKKQTGKITEDAPITTIVSNILKHAAETETSDVHIEPFDYGTDVRYRIDGVLQKDLTLPRVIHESVVARIKILSKIKLDEKRIPQDGRFSADLLGRKIDFRVSTFPTYYGEKCVMRLLESERGARSIDDLGFSAEDLAKVKKAVKRSFGILLVCGPTGSGKTNTLYSLLNELPKETENIVSLENPIELNIPGVIQSQMRTDIGYTFAKGLRSVLRQDPDIIMVGEIRDTETAKLAIQAALTGHLVLSTIHTNTAADVVQRLVDMGVERYLIGPTLIAVIGQRLARTIAPGCAKAEPLSDSIKQFIEKQVADLPDVQKQKFANIDSTNIVVPNETYPTGMKGRTGVFEVMEINKDIERIILKDPSSLAIHEAARGFGFVTFKENAILKAAEGTIPLEEAMQL